MQSVDRIRAEPAPEVVVEALGDSSVNLLVRIWIDDAQDRDPTIYGVVEAGKLALDEAGIEIPFPHMQLFVDDVRERVWSGATALTRPRQACPTTPSFV